MTQPTLGDPEAISESGLPWGRIGIGAGVIALLLLLLFLFTRGGDAEEPLPDGTQSAVMCLPEEEVGASAGDATVAPVAGTETGTTPGSEGTPARLVGGVELFFQNDGRWTDTEYAFSTTLPGGKDWCGFTIGQCGCAMTSLANVLALFDLVSTPTGEALQPESFNGWLNRDAQFQGQCFISPGYYCGQVVWTDIQAFTAQRRQEDPSVPLLRYRGRGNGSEAEVRAELEAGRPVILEVRGHFVLAAALEDGEIVIQDPYYPDRTRYADIAPMLISSRLFEIAERVGGLVIMAQGDTEVTITDSEGRVTGTSTSGASGAGDPATPDPVEADIPGSSVNTEALWRDPTCVERAPDPDAPGNVELFLPRAPVGDYTVDVQFPPGDERCIAIYHYADDGTVTIETICGTGTLGRTVSHNPGSQTPTPTPTPPPTETPSPTPTPEVVEPETPTPTAEPVTPTAEPRTPTPAPRTPTPRPPTPEPSAPDVRSVSCTPSVNVAASVACQVTATGTVTSYAWSTQGSPSSGSQASFTTSYATPGVKRVDIRACNGSRCDTGSASVNVLAPIVATFSCGSVSNVQVNQNVTCNGEPGQGAYSWTATGGSPASGSTAGFTTRFGTAGAKTITLSVCNASGCQSQSLQVDVKAALTVTAFCSPGQPSIGEQINCSAQVTGGVPQTFAWVIAPSSPIESFGQDSPSFTAYIYDTGPYTVGVNVCTETACGGDTVTINVVEAESNPEPPPNETPCCSFFSTAALPPVGRGGPLVLIL